MQDAHRRQRSPSAPGWTIVIAAALIAVLLPLAAPHRVEAGTAETMEASILGWINSARSSRGLGLLRDDPRLSGLAGDRVAAMAAQDTMSHDVAGCLSCQLTDRGIAWNEYGEVLALNSWPWGQASAKVVFESWRDSPTHWDILMSTTLDSIGIGVAESSAGVTYASGVLIDAPGASAIKPKPKTTPRPTTPPLAAPTATPQLVAAATATAAATPALPMLPTPCHPG